VVDTFLEKKKKAGPSWIETLYHLNRNSRQVIKFCSFTIYKKYCFNIGRHCPWIVFSQRNK